jgi:phytoene dehydrogenase-like protein
MHDYDAIVVGAGVAGMGLAALLQQSGKKTLLVDRWPNPGGRMQSYALESGYTLDTGLHVIEMGKKGYCHEMAARAGAEIEWANWTNTLEIFVDGKWVDMNDYIQLSEEEKQSFINVMMQVAAMQDNDFDAWDNRSFAQWLDHAGMQGRLRETWENMSMIMTTIPDSDEQSAGECLYIAREALVKSRRILTAAYPRKGMAGIIEPLIKAFTGAGGTLKLGTMVDQVVFEGKKVRGVRMRTDTGNPLAREWRFNGGTLVSAPLVVLALPIWFLDTVLDFHPQRAVLPPWWIKRVQDIKGERTGLFGYIVATRRPLYEKPNFLSALSTPRTGYPFQAYSPSAYDESVAPAGRHLLVTDSVCEPWEVEDKFNLMAKMESHWEDIKEMFGFEDGEVEFAYPYYTTGCDGLARKPGLTGNFKPDVEAPGVQGLYFAGDTYLGRGLAVEGACKSALLCFERITG